MLPTLLFGLQAVSGPVLPVPKVLRAAPGCDRSAEGDEVVVCARTDQPDRLKPVPEHYTEPTIPKAEVRVFGNARLSAETEQAGVGGFPSNRAMMRLKIPF